VPELVEVELYRRLAERVVGRFVERVDAPDPWFLKGATSVEALVATLVGGRTVGSRRRGKLLLLDTAGGAVLGIRFGMTGRLVVDGQAAIERLEYSSGRDDPAWTRFALGFTDGGELRVVDPRRLGGVELDPSESALGADARDLSIGGFRDALAGARGPVKARLLDQRRIAGVGNLVADEVLWRASIDPGRDIATLDAADLRRLHQHLVETVTLLLERGGSHLGDLHPARQAGGLCPRDGSPLQRRTVGGRTTWSCPRHQR
jgi:formamidopyrimidine-DNA glycosylase